MFLALSSKSWMICGMKIPRLLRIFLKITAVVLLLAIILAGSLWIYFHPQFQRTSNLVYGKRQGQDLTMDVVRPGKPNGIGVVLMVSGGWKSGPGSFRPWMVAPLLRRGYTVFAISHISQPQSTIMEITDDVNRGVRYVRHNAHDFGIDPARIGVTGGSSGGHLSLMLATRGGPGTTNTTDAIDAESSAVQAVAIFYPVTDLINLGKSTENLGDGGPPKSFVKGFGPDATNLTVWKVIGHDLSPIFFVNSNLPPTLIYHGDADTLVPLDQSQRFQVEARKAGRTVEIVVHPGGKHGWLSMLLDIQKFADWFDKYLRKTNN